MHNQTLSQIGKASNAKSDTLNDLKEYQKVKFKERVRHRKELVEVEILNRRKRKMELEKEIKEEEIRLAEQEKLLMGLADELKIKANANIGNVVLHFQQANLLA